MNTNTFKGDFFEMGKQQGETYRKNGMNFDSEKIDNKLYQNQLKIYKKHYPELLEEFRGMAEAGNFDRDALTYRFITAEITWYKKWLDSKKACTIFGVKSGNDLFVGRNYDWLPQIEKLFGVYKVINPTRHSFIAVTDMAYAGEAGVSIKNLFYNADDAINDKGLFIGLTFACADQLSYGLSCVHMIKLIAETCSTVEEVLKVFKKVPLAVPKNFFIADKHGNMAIVEHAAKKYKVVYPKNNVLIQTNHYVDPELAKEDTVLERSPAHNTFLRYYETLQKIYSQKDNFKLSNVAHILCKPGTHTCQNFPRMKTIWTLALDMTHQKYEIYWDISGKRKKKKLVI
jgi:predicted choloylglycine hydrolase